MDSIVPLYIVFEWKDIIQDAIKMPGGGYWEGSYWGGSYWGRKLLREEVIEGGSYWGGNLLREEVIEGGSYWGRIYWVWKLLKTNILITKFQ